MLTLEMYTFIWKKLFIWINWFTLAGWVRDEVKSRNSYWVYNPLTNILIEFSLRIPKSRSKILHIVVVLAAENFQTLAKEIWRTIKNRAHLHEKCYAALKSLIMTSYIWPFPSKCVLNGSHLFSLLLCLNCISTLINKSWTRSDSLISEIYFIILNPSRVTRIASQIIIFFIKELYFNMILLLSLSTACEERSRRPFLKE